MRLVSIHGRANNRRAPIPLSRTPSLLNTDVHQPQGTPQALALILNRMMTHQCCGGVSARDHDLTKSVVMIIV